MTRRTVIFIDENGCLWSSPEFNGDKREFELFKTGDRCTANWSEILDDFKEVYTLEQFKDASDTAQNHYESVLGADRLHVMKFDRGLPWGDETYLAVNGGLFHLKCVPDADEQKEKKDMLIKILMDNGIDSDVEIVAEAVWDNFEETPYPEESEA